MNPVQIVAILVGLVAISTALGLLWKSRTGRVRETSAAAAANIVDLPEVHLAERATLLQFSTEVCAPCVPTRRVLGEIAKTSEGVGHVDIDLTHRPDLAARFNVLQTPTTLVLDKTGAIRARIGGAPRPLEVRALLEGIS